MTGFFPPHLRSTSVDREGQRESFIKKAVYNYVIWNLSCPKGTGFISSLRSEMGQRGGFTKKTIYNFVIWNLEFVISKGNWIHFLASLGNGPLEGLYKENHLPRFARPGFSFFRKLEQARFAPKAKTTS
ncbi:hypothetical protein ACA086_12410 [Muriicola sp. E247]|uniref:hypothetical protein n=1 Tax=Muriicola sp. E247 TaxID=3242730 RepID=UPI003523D667